MLKTFFSLQVFFVVFKSAFWFQKVWKIQVHFFFFKAGECPEKLRNKLLKRSFFTSFLLCYEEYQYFDTLF